MSEDNDVSIIAPTQPLFPLAARPFYEMLYIYVQDIGHEEDAYYKLGWHCISRHGPYSLLCTDGVVEELKFLLMEKQ
jgi:hypothetical protein